MSRVRALLQFVWEFVVGDDWRIALGVVGALVVTALAADSRLTAWWILPVATVGVLALSVWRAARVAR
jgi:hypothetical protein